MVYELRTLLDSAPDAMFVVDRDGVIVLLNAQAGSLFGYPHDELIGKKIEQLVPERFRGDHSRLRAGYCSSAPRVRAMGAGLELFALRKDGSEFPAEISLSPIQTAEGLFVVSAIRDVSDRKQTESEIRKLNRQLETALQRSEKLAATGRLAMTIAHEINNPLEAAGNLVFLLKHGREDGEEKKLIHTLEQQLDQIKNIVRHTLAPHRQAVELVETSLGELLDDVCLTFDVRLKKAGIHVSRAYSGDGLVKLPPSDLRQVFTNLIANAIDAMPAGGDLKLAFSSQEQFVSVEITDSGCGIAEDSRPHVFQQLFTTKGEKGTGVGLWVTRNIVESLGGTITFTSSTNIADHGTSFVVRIPSLQKTIAGSAA